MLYEYLKIGGIIIAKVIFEFDEEEDRIEIENIMKRDNFIYALERWIYRNRINTQRKFKRNCNEKMYTC